MNKLLLSIGTVLVAATAFAFPAMAQDTESDTEEVEKCYYIAVEGVEISELPTMDITIHEFELEDDEDDVVITDEDGNITIEVEKVVGDDLAELPPLEDCEMIQIEDIEGLDWVSEEHEIELYFPGDELPEGFNFSFEEEEEEYDDDNDDGEDDDDTEDEDDDGEDDDDDDD